MVVRGAKGEAGDGLCKAWTMSWMPRRIKSVDDEFGIGTMVGSQVKVSQMRRERDSQIHTV